MQDPLAWQVRLLDAAGQPVGGGMVVDEQHVVTCAHVVTRALNQRPPTVEVPAGPVHVDFLAADSGVLLAHVAAGGWVPTNPAGRGDVAVLDLATPLPEGVEAAPLRRATRLQGHRFDVIGFPRGPGYETGVSASGVVGRPGGPGRQWVELQGIEVPGHRIEQGFSGAPVYDHQLDAVVGIVVAEDKLAEAKLAWMLPVGTLATYWPGLEPLVRAWAMWGPGELEGHWSPRARGVSREFQPGWYFTGRRQVLHELVAWLTGERADGRVRVVTGGPGSGKSAVLARLVTLADPRYRARIPGLDLADATVPPAGSVDVAVHARGKTLEDLVAAIASATEVEADTPDGLIDVLGRRGRPFTIVVDALDEASDPVAAAGRLLRPLAAEAASVGMRVLAGTRPGSRLHSVLTSGRSAIGPAGEILQALGTGTVIFDLDHPPYLESADLVEYVRRRLLLVDEPHLSTPYRDDPDLAERVARAVAERAYPAFLVAQLVSGALVQDLLPVDVHAPHWPARFPASVADAMAAYLDRFEASARRRVRDLLTPLAYAEGVGLPRDQIWPALASALSGRRYQAEDVDWLLDTAADYLIERTEADGWLVYRLYHEALAEYLRPPDAEVEQTAHQRLTHTLLDLVPPSPNGGRQWIVAYPYLRAHLATHAATAGVLDELLDDPEFLLAADPVRLLRVLPAASTPAGRQAARVYRLALHQLRNRPLEEAAACLELAARQQRANELAGRIEQLGLSQPWSARWAVWQPTTDHYIAGRHAGSINALVIGELNGRPIVVTGADDKTVRVWDLHTGAQVGEPLTGHTGSINALAIGELNGRPIVVTGADDKTVRVWDLHTGAQVGTPLTGHIAPILAVAVGEVDGRPVAVTGGFDDRERAWVWDLRAGVPVGELLLTYWIGGYVSAVAISELDGRPIVITGLGSFDDRDRLRVWDLRKGVPVGGPLIGHTDMVDAVAVAELDGRPVAITGSKDDTVRVWDLRTGTQVGEPLTGHTGWVMAVAVAELDGRPVAITGSEDDTARVWDLRTGTQVGEPLTGHTNWVRAVAISELDGRPVAITGSEDDTVRVWDLHMGAQVGEALTGHTRPLTAVAVSELDGRRVAITGSLDKTVRAWDLHTGAPVGKPLTGNRARIHAMAVGEVDGRPVAVIGGWTGGKVRVWDLRTGAPISKPLTGHSGPVHAIAFGELSGRPIAVTGADDVKVRVWDLRAGAPVGEPLTGHTNIVYAVAVGDVDGRPVAVTGSADKTVRVWDLRTGAPVGEPITGHTEVVFAVAVGEVDGRPVAVTGSAEGTVRVWDLRTGAPVGEPLTGHTGSIRAAAVGELDGRPVAITGGSDKMVRVWDLRARRAQTADIGDDIRALEYVRSSRILVAASRGLVLLQLMRRTRNYDVSR